ncbi:OLC1v1038098C1 [Oldenlandia corymbosa var. corymbosa]|uniref:CASP-like protein n=1 Tax=Oldenlandia corymbosa var. corymbosa TaxID=529605 RepID=A0AAV1D087_OLDCO|nr:OLC1v1038098C1 [Oldenlandia corymbosa var. corymbosa]
MESSHSNSNNLHHSQNNGGNNNTNNNNSKPPRRFFKSNSNVSNRSMSLSDTESQFESFHSPLRSESPLRSDDPIFKSSPPSSNSKQIVSVPVDKYYSPLRSPKKPTSGNSSFATTPMTEPPTPSPSGLVMFNRSVKDGVPPGVEKVEMGLGGGGGGGVAGQKPHRQKKDLLVKKAALGFRLCQVILCVIAFSVMAADKTQGWSGDSFDRYKEYRYLVAVNVIGFVYAAFQACDLACYLPTGNQIIAIPLRNHFDFSIDQVLAYLLMSASSSAATRVDDWVSNWGKDEFTEMASAAISMSFLAFFAFALSSLMSGYFLCSQDTT